MEVERATLAGVLAGLAREGDLREPAPGGRVRCVACGHRCLIPPGQRGICKVRWNDGGRLMVPAGYVGALQLDPVEKKPFFHAYPGARALSFGMLGCDFHCAYCFTGDTPVLTPGGGVPVEHLFESSPCRLQEPGGQVAFPERLEVVSAAGQPRRVLKVFKHRYRGAVTAVKPVYLPALRCTPDHRFLATEDPAGGAVREIPAAQLTSSHYLLVPKPVWAGDPVAIDLRGIPGAFLVPVASVSTEPFDGDVYNLEVEDEHSYVAGFVAVKNCQNWLTSQSLRDPAAGVMPQRITPDEIVSMALRHGARIVTSTYNEPLITSEWAVEVFRAARDRGLVCSYVSNGNATPEALDYLRPWVDLYKVDLKGFDDRRYRTLGGLLRTVLDTIVRLHASGFWVEVVTLIVPGFNDGDGELRDIARFLSSVSPDIPWHVTAFHPDYRMTDRDGTTRASVLRAAEIAVSEGVRYVYAGNLHGSADGFENTYCPSCGALLVERRGYVVLRDLVTPARGRCPSCRTPIPGRWDRAEGG